MKRLYQKTNAYATKKGTQICVPFFSWIHQGTVTFPYIVLLFYHICNFICKIVFSFFETLAFFQTNKLRNCDWSA